MASNLRQDSLMTRPVNPWLRIPLADYEGHMGAAEVRQLGVLADLFGEALRICAPKSIAVLGIAGGNGLDTINTATIERVVGIDINADYLEETARRFRRLPLELHCLDLATLGADRISPVDLVHAALIFEHAGIRHCLDNALQLTNARGHLSVVLQLPTDVGQALSPSLFATMQQLRDEFTFVDRTAFVNDLAARGLSLVSQSIRRTEAGKEFWLGVFQRQVGSGIATAEPKSRKP